METGQRLYSLLGGSLQARANNPPHPLRPGLPLFGPHVYLFYINLGGSGVCYDEANIIASFNSLIRVYNFEPAART